MHLLPHLLLTLLTPTLITATGTFLYPSGPSGSLTVTTGNTIDISWTNTTDYDILSLGYFSSSNQTITWLISNSVAYPSSYRWTVDAVAQGFNLAESSLFAFNIVNGTNFGDPFVSSEFIVSDGSGSASGASSTSSTSTTTGTASPTSAMSATDSTSTSPTPTTNTNTGTGTAAAASNTSTPSNPNPSKSSSLSGGAIAGIVIGALLLLAALAAAAYLIFRRRRRNKYTAGPHGKDGVMSEAPAPAPASAYGISSERTDHTRSGGAGYKKDLGYTAVHEADGSAPGSGANGHRGGPVELGLGHDGVNGGGRVELA